MHDEGIFATEVLEARLLKEEAALETWRADTADFSSLKELHAWMHATHLCYSVSRQVSFHWFCQCMGGQSMHADSAMTCSCRRTLGSCKLQM